MSKAEANSSPVDKRDVVLFWKREQYEDGACTASDSFTIDHAIWTFRGGANYVIYEEDVSDSKSGKSIESGKSIGNGKSEKSIESGKSSESGQSAESGLAVRTTLRISRDELTLIRHGAVRWNHSFKALQKTSSTMYAMGSPLSIETMTKSLVVNMTGNSGEVLLVYDMDLSGMTQTVKLWIRFGEHDGEGKEETKNN